MVESRGKKEDQDLKPSYSRRCSNGTKYLRDKKTARIEGYSKKLLP